MQLPLTRSAIDQGIARGLHSGTQLCVLRNGQPLADLAIGNARIDVPMTPDTLMLWLSAGKPITAVAIAMLMERGLLVFDDPVARHIPEFAANGKAAITIRQLLTHTAGIRAADLKYPFATWEETIQSICAMHIERDWVPGQKAGYHTHASWYILGEIINRVTGAAHDRWIRENLFLPLGMKDTWLAMDAATYHAYGERIGFLYDTTREPMAPVPNVDTELAASRPRPSASGRGPMHDLARFYEMLRNGGSLDGVRILSETTVREMTSRQRVGMLDLTFRQTIDWGLGFIVHSSHYGPAIPYQFGLASPETFGHGGSQSSTGFCDPVNRLAVALVFNGCPGEPAHDKRMRTVLAALYRDLGIG